MGVCVCVLLFNYHLNLQVAIRFPEITDIKLLGCRGHVVRKTEYISVFYNLMPVNKIVILINVFI